MPSIDVRRIDPPRRLLIAVALIGLASPAAAQTCLQAAGRAKSAEYVRHCREVSPATRPPCNAVNSCELIISEIERGCRMFTHEERPKLCAAYLFDRR